jgi:hypothetical protein
MLRFKYPVGKINVFINAGLSNGYAILEKNNMKQVAKFYTMETSKEDKALTKSSRYERGYLGGLGARYNRYSFEARYERGDGMSRLTNYSSSTNRFFFLIGYLF